MNPDQDHYEPEYHDTPAFLKYMSQHVRVTDDMYFPMFNVLVRTAQPPLYSLCHCAITHTTHSNILLLALLHLIFLGMYNLPVKV